jgi:hypothetical protein
MQLYPVHQNKRQMPSPSFTPIYSFKPHVLSFNHDSSPVLSTRDTSVTLILKNSLNLNPCNSEFWTHYIKELLINPSPTDDGRAAQKISSAGQRHMTLNKTMTRRPVCQEDKQTQPTKGWAGKGWWKGGPKWTHSMGAWSCVKVTLTRVTWVLQLRSIHEQGVQLGEVV